MSFDSTSSSPSPTPTTTSTSSSDGIIWMTFTDDASTIIDYIDSSGNFYVPSSSSGVGSTRRTLSSTGQSGSYGQYRPSPTPSGVAVTSNYGVASSSINPSSNLMGNGNYSTGSEQSSNTGTGTEDSTRQLSLVHIIVISVIGMLVIMGCVTGCCLCKRRRRRRRANRDRKRLGGNEPKLDLGDIPSPLSANTTYPPRISHRDLDNILIHPSPSLSPITPIPNSATPFFNRPSSRRTQTDSLYTDNSEFDMLAQDGSSYARTLSTYSEGINSEYSERDLGGGGTYVSLNSGGGHGVGRSLVGRPRLEVDTKSPDGPSTSTPISASGWNGNTLSPSYNATSTPTLSNPHTHSSTAATNTLISPFSDPSYAQPPISPISITSTNRSWRTEDEVLLMARPSQSQSTRITPHPQSSTALGRSTTIIRHTDGGAVDPFRSDDDEVRERDGHLPPPSYGELYPQTR